MTQDKALLLVQTVLLPLVLGTLLPVSPSLLVLPRDLGDPGENKGIKNRNREDRIMGGGETEGRRGRERKKMVIFQFTWAWQ